MTETSCLTQPLYSNIGTDLDFQESVALFVEEMPPHPKNPELSPSPQPKGLHHICHQLKGPDGGYGFPPISLAADQVVQAIRKPGPEEDIRQSVGIPRIAVPSSQSRQPLIRLLFRNTPP